jgi:hypothetical protein
VNVVLGNHRVSPNYAAKPYTEIVGDDQYLRLLFCVGYGPLHISDLRIGETPIASFDGVTVEIRQGFPTDTPITLYPGVVNEVSLSILLENFHDHGGVDGPQGGEWQSQTTAPNTNAIGVDFTATKGMFYSNQKTGEAVLCPVGAI